MNDRCIFDLNQLFFTLHNTISTPSIRFVG
jgi:hypothetical protein